MTQVFGYEKLRVYQRGVEFAAMRKDMLAHLPRRVAACGHLERAAESVLVNIAHASSSWSPKERLVYLGHANGSALECAACLDIFVAKKLLAAEDVYSAKCLLAEIVSMLLRMRQTTVDRVREAQARYGEEDGKLFSHERLDVYQAELQLVAWVESMLPHFSCSSDVLSKLDGSTTSMVLNTAEGNGRFSGKDQSKFLDIAYKAAVQSAALIDIAVGDASAAESQMKNGRVLLKRITAMLTSLKKAVTHDA